MDDINYLLEHCKASVTITVNDHRDSYMGVEDYMRNTGLEQWLEDIPAEVLEQMVDRDTMVRVQFYPHTPIGFYIVYHYDLGTALRQAVKILKEVINEETKNT